MALCRDSIAGGVDGLISYKQIGQRVIVDLYNSDGSPAGFSGNGFACTAKQVFLECEEKSLILESAVSNIGVVYSNEIIKLIIPVMKSNIHEKYPFHHMVGSIPYSLIYVGNEHAVFFDTIDDSKVESYFADSKRFPDGININLARVVHDHEIELDVIERGCGRTSACTSGALATVIAAIREKRCKLPVVVKQVGGFIYVERDAEGQYLVDLHPEILGMFEWDGKTISPLT